MLLCVSLSLQRLDLILNLDGLISNSPFLVVVRKIGIPRDCMRMGLSQQSFGNIQGLCDLNGKIRYQIRLNSLAYFQVVLFRLCILELILVYLCQSKQIYTINDKRIK